MSIYSRPVRFTEAEGKSDAFEILLKELGITVEPKGALEQICLDVKELADFHRGKAKPSPSADLRPHLRTLMGLDHLVSLALDLGAKKLRPFKEHLALLNEGTPQILVLVQGLDVLLLEDAGRFLEPIADVQTFEEEDQRVVLDREQVRAVVRPSAGVACGLEVVPEAPVPAIKLSPSVLDEMKLRRSCYHRLIVARASAAPATCRIRETLRTCPPRSPGSSAQSSCSARRSPSSGSCSEPTACPSEERRASRSP